jgi:phosphoadenosine phosphosulfate reductase
MGIDHTEINHLNRFLEISQPKEILKWCHENLQNEIAMTTSLQISGMVILDLLNKAGIEIPVYFIDTGFHFQETYDFKLKVESHYNISINTISPEDSKDKFEHLYGKCLHDRDPDFCCLKNKIEPQNAIMNGSGYTHWLSAIRKDQSQSRANFKVLMLDENEFIRVHPLLNWKWDDVWDYINKNNVPYHPLYSFGYSSIGCAPESCTSQGNFEQGERSGRWKNTTKTECGLHQKLSVAVDHKSIIQGITY